MTHPHEEYLNTIARMEPDITLVDTGAALASIAISLKRVADALAHGSDASGLLADKLHDAIFNALVNVDRQRR